jgi:toxin ParE1/3/4
MKAIVLRDSAKHDAELAFDYYAEEATAKVALDFVADLEKAYRHIGRSPATGSTRYAFALDIQGLRSWPMSHFPYLIFYFERDDHVDVWRVMQSQRDIPNWMGED